MKGYPKPPIVPLFIKTKIKFRWFFSFQIRIVQSSHKLKVYIISLYKWNNFVSRNYMQIGVWRQFDTCTNVVQYLSLERDNAQRYLNTVILEQQVKSSGNWLGRQTQQAQRWHVYEAIPINMYMLLGVSSYTCVIILAMQNVTCIELIWSRMNT